MLDRNLRNDPAVHYNYSNDLSDDNKWLAILGDQRNCLCILYTLVSFQTSKVIGFASNQSQG